MIAQEDSSHPPDNVLLAAVKLGHVKEIEVAMEAHPELLPVRDDAGSLIEGEFSVLFS